MREKIIYIVTIIISIAVGVMGTVFTIHYFPITSNTVEKTVKSVSIEESNTIKESVDKIYNAVVVVESYKNGRNSGSGSGFVYKKNDKLGYIITNHHVIEGATSVKVVMMSGESVDATVLGSDQYADLAVLSISSEAVLAVASIGKSEALELGDTLFTVGTPVGSEYMGTVTKGILSGKNRTVSVSLANSGNFMMDVLQTDAAINPGNSGGPLVNINGEVVGVNSMKLVEDEIEGMGFAIPIELVMTTVDSLEKGEVIQRPLLGVSLIDASNTYSLYYNRITIDKEIESGVVIAQIEKDSPAEKAGFVVGDVIVELGDSQVDDTAQFRYNLYKYNVGDKVKIKYFRDGKLNEVEVTLDKSMEA